MTLQELKRDTQALGFETDHIDDEIFIPAVNRSLRNIFNDLCITKKVKLYAEPIIPLTIVDKARHFGRSSETYPLRGKAWSFEVSGVGSFSIKDGHEVRVTEFNTQRKVFSGFLKYGGSITFLGDFSYTAYGLATFDYLISDEPSDIPVVCHNREYDMRKICPDFQSFAAYPRTKDNESIYEARMADGVLTLPNEFEGEFSVEYKRAPKLVTLDTPDDESIDISSGAEALVPLLVASYVWLSDDEERAKYYKSMYKEGLDRLTPTLKHKINTSYVRTNGWAR